MDKATKIFKKHWIKATGKELDGMTKYHMQYAIDAINEALELAAVYIKTTTFVLKYLPFDVMESGEKRVEFREVKPWTINRLYGKNGKQKVSHIKFVRGYGKKARSFTSKIKRISIESFGHIEHYSNGLMVDLKAGKKYFHIELEKPIINISN